MRGDIAKIATFSLGKNRKNWIWRSESFGFFDRLPTLLDTCEYSIPPKCRQFHQKVVILTKSRTTSPTEFSLAFSPEQKQPENPPKFRTISLSENFVALSSEQKLHDFTIGIFRSVYLGVFAASNMRFLAFFRV